MNSSSFSPSPSASCASSAASMSSFSSDSSSSSKNALSKSAENMKAPTNATTSISSSSTALLFKNNEIKNNKEETFHNQNIFVDNYNNNYNNNKNTLTNESPSMAILARVKKLQHETSRDECFRFISSTLNNFDENFPDMIMIHHEGTSEEANATLNQRDDVVVVVEDVAMVEKVAVSLRSKIEILIQSFAGAKVASNNFKNASFTSLSTSTFSSMPNSAFKSTSTSGNDLPHVALKSGSPTQFDESFISSLFSILFASNFKSKFCFLF